MSNPIEIAVMPLKDDAIESAQKYAERTIELVKQDLSENGWDLNAVAPYPSSRQGRLSYSMALAKHRLYTSVTRSVTGSYMFNKPDIVRMDEEAVDRFIGQAKKDAAFQYDAFVAKLVSKIGPCDNAALKGSHVWGSSILTVTKGGLVEKWKTQQIINVSKLGKVFNQWPSRKMKG